MIRRDTGELPKSVRWTLGVLRLFAIACVIVYLLNPGERSESRLITNSRLAVLIDTSLSMGLPAESSTSQNKQSRIDTVVEWITTDSELNRLRQQHDLSIYRFGDTATPGTHSYLDEKTIRARAGFCRGSGGRGIMVI